MMQDYAVLQGHPFQASDNPRNVGMIEAQKKNLWPGTASQ